MESELLPVRNAGWTGGNYMVPVRAGAHEERRTLASTGVQTFRLATAASLLPVRADMFDVLVRSN